MFQFFFLVVFAYIGFYDTHGLHIFLNRLVQGIVFFENPLKQRQSFADHHEKAEAQDRCHNQKYDCHFSAHDKRHDKGENQHQGTTDGSPDNHHVSKLDVGHIGGEPRHQGGSGKSIYIFKGKSLYFIKNILPEVPGQATGCCRTGGSGEGAEQKRKSCHQDKYHSVPGDHIQSAAGFDLVHQPGGHKGYDAFKYHFDADPDNCLNGWFFVFPYTFDELFPHKILPLPYLKKNELHHRWTAHAFVILLLILFPWPCIGIGRDSNSNYNADK